MARAAFVPDLACMACSLFWGIDPLVCLPYSGANCWKWVTGRFKFESSQADLA